MGQVTRRFYAIGVGKAKAPVSKVGRIALVFGVGLMVANCGATSSKLASKVDPKYGVSASPRVVAFGEPVPKGGGVYRVGKPYTVAGRVYTPEENTRYKSEGIASWYGDDFHGRMTANGEVFDMESIAAAHPTLPMPCYARVTNLDNGRSMIVRVNDRGPYHSDRIMDVSARAADLLGFKARGTARVRVEYAGRAPIEGSDDRKLVATLRNDGAAPLPSNSAVMVASNGNVPTARLPSADVPMPPDRPFDLGSSQVAMSEPVAHTQVAAAPLPKRAAAATPTTVQPAPVAVAAKPRPAQSVAQVANAPMVPRVATASVQPAKEVVASSGWMVGAQPVTSYAPAGMVTPVSSGRGLY